MKKAIIIGASSGIGKELASLLARNHFKIGITGRRVSLLEEVKKDFPESMKVMLLDITETHALDEKLSTLVNQLDGLDLLVISAGIGDLNSNLDVEIETATITANVQGFTAVADWAYCFFQKQGHGHLVAISSIAGLRGSGIAPAYNASKAYQINYLEGLRQKAKGNITVTDIRPGFVKTAMAKGDGQFWVASAEKAAHQILCAIREKKRVAYVTKRWQLIAMLLKLAPRNWYERI